MSMLKVSNECAKIMVTTARNPGITIYELAKRAGLYRITVARYLKGKDFACQEGLVKDGLIKIVAGKRKSDKCYLTFKGLLYALNIGVIKPSEAAEIRQAHGIEPPPRPDGEVAKMFDWALPPPSSAEETIERIKNRLKKTAPDKVRAFFDYMDECARRMREDYDFIVAKYGREPAIAQYIEREFSEQIYGALLRTVNILFYDPIIAGYYYHNLILMLSNTFIFNVYLLKEKQAVKEYLNILKKDDMTFEIAQKVMLPFLLKFPWMPEKFKKGFQSLANASREEFLQYLEHFLLQNNSQVKG